MIRAVETYLAVRRAVGFELLNADYLLRSFARFAAERGETAVRSATAIDWASQTASVEQRDERLKTVCRFVRYIRAEDNRHELPPSKHFGHRKTRRVPHIYSRVEIRRLMDAALQLKPADSLQRHTYATLIGLLATTGLRISEALSLQLTDVTADGLRIRKTKFQKTRLVPLHPSTTAGVDRYLTRRQQTRSKGNDVFIADDGAALRYGNTYRTFQKLLKIANLLPPIGRPPRLHQIRHTFAVRSLEASPVDRQHIGRHMLALATYLGHANIYSTYWYLEITPELVRDIAVTSEAFFCGGQS
jgi:integrase/recombinase XerD